MTACIRFIKNKNHLFRINKKQNHLVEKILKMKLLARLPLINFNPRKESNIAFIRVFYNSQNTFFFFILSTKLQADFSTNKDLALKGYIPTFCILQMPFFPPNLY